MRNMNCRNVQSEIEEAGPGHLLSAAVYAHMESCAACERLSREQDKLQEIISSLGTVEAPGDFDFRLRARLAAERRGMARPFALGDFSFGFRSATVAMTLLLIGAAFIFVSFRTRVDNPAVADASKSVTPSSATNPIQGNSGVKTSVPPSAVRAPESQPNVVQASVGAGDGYKRREARRGAATASGGNRVGTRETSLTTAPVLTRYDQLAETYPTAAFPINASYQSLKVSVDDGRGSSRTISLPTVSFGSQRALSQNASPLMAQARGVW